MSDTPRFTGLAPAFAYYTECALATAEHLDLLKSASNSGRQRAWSIANGMVATCLAHGVTKADAPRCPRLQKLMEASHDPE